MRNLLVINDGKTPWLTEMADFLNSESCPSFMKSEVGSANAKTYDDSDQEEVFEEETEQPEWMDVIRKIG